MDILLLFFIFCTERNPSSGSAVILGESITLTHCEGSFPFKFSLFDAFILFCFLRPHVAGGCHCGNELDLKILKEQLVFRLAEEQLTILYLAFGL